jgi:hypothetical protein
VKAVPSAAESSHSAERSGSRTRPWVPWLILACYLAAAFVVTWRLWADPAGRSPVGDPGPADVDLFTWYLRYEATAVAHGHLPALVTTAMNAPRGINLMWNTSILLPGTLLAPLTLAAGPQVTLTVLLTLGFAGSAASLYFVLRRWGASLGAAALGGAVYGFSPAMTDSGIAGFHMHFAVLPPLIVDALLRIVTGRGRPVRTGVWLGLLTAAQLLTAEELGVSTALAALVLIIALAASRRQLIADCARRTVPGLAAGAVVTAVLCAYPLWEQFRGRLAEHGSPYQSANFAAAPWSFVTPPGTLALHTASSAATAANYPSGLWENFGYLGWPLLVVLVAAAIWFWRDLRVRAAAVTWAVLELCALGSTSVSFGGLRYPGALLPWHWLAGLPVIGQLLPTRLPLIADGAAAAVLAFSLDLARAAGRRGVAGRLRNALPAAVAVLAVLPIIPLPVQTIPVAPVPAGWQAAFTRLKLAPDDPVLVVPAPYAHSPDALRWQATTGQPGSLVAGWFIGAAPDGHAAVEFFGPPQTTEAVVYLDKLWAGIPDADIPPAQDLRFAMSYWRPAAVVAVTGPHSRVERVLAGLFGPPTFRAGSVLVWRR